MSPTKMEAILDIANWFASSNGTFLRVFNREISPHAFPRYVNNKIFMQGVSYHLATGLSAVLHRKKKASWLTLPMKIGFYEIKNLKVSDTKGKAINNFAFST